MTTQTQAAKPPKPEEKSLGPVATVQKLLEDNKRQIAMALPKHLTMDRLIRTSLTAIQRNPKLLECHPSTLGGAVMMCAIWGVEPIGAGGAWLVPFRNTRKNRMEVQFIVDYRGLANIARNSGEVKKVEWHEVHAKDTFKYQYGTDPKIEHTPYQGAGDAGPLTHVYAVGFYNDGTAHFVVLTRDEALKSKKRSKASDSGPWVTDEIPMCLKTAVRRLCNQLPMSPEKQNLVSLEERAEIGIPQDLGTLVDEHEQVTDTTAEQTPDDGSPEYSMPKRTTDAEKPPAEGAAAADKAKAPEASKTDATTRSEDVLVDRAAKTTLDGKPAIVITDKEGVKYYADFEDEKARDGVLKMAKENEVIHAEYETRQGVHRILEVSPVKPIKK